MKTCIISRSFPPEICGVGGYTFWLAESLKNMGNEVSVITSKDRRRETEYQKTRVSEPEYQKTEDRKQGAGDEGSGIGDIKIFRVESWKLLHIIEIIKTLKHITPDVVIIQYVCQMYGRAGIAPGIVFLPFLIKLNLKTKQARLRIVITFHELWIPFRSGDFILGVIQRMEAGVLTLIADAVVVTVKSREKVMRKIFPWKKVYKIPVGTNIYKIRKSEVKSNEETCPAKGGVILSSFGTLHPERDVKTLLKVVSLIEECELYMLGKIAPDEYERYKEIERSLGIEKRVYWTGTISEKEIANYLVNSDIYISPELEGASGRRTTLMAALYLGLPVIAYDGRDTEDFLKNNENIILVEAGNIELIAGAIKKLANDDSLRNKLGVKAQEIFEQYFSWEVIGKKYEEIFKSLSGEPVFYASRQSGT